MFSRLESVFQGGRGREHCRAIIIVASKNHVEEEDRDFIIFVSICIDSQTIPKTKS